MELTHAALVKRAATWLANHGAVVVCTEVVAWQCPESPDVIGWGYDGISYVVEVKVSRADFLGDKAKPHRSGKVCGLGVYRYYAAPRGLIDPTELPEGWGLIETSGNGMRQRRTAFAQECHDMREKVLLVQMLRYGWNPSWRAMHNAHVAGQTPPEQGGG